ncbi:MAG: flagellar FlbD family protein [Candidatus Eremiobacteraeota bacterium]|nr:flagellar FlbD family protein [Candidatus Eremiobacteraeota bacterium]MBV8283366.1 flagellar FlbD family protein [Candidatus Eremiobacteraeota bacterium]MBV8332112.1 flagellar FlbD family protein [Candidatus Eremiobacteraeota bacterium]MBV8433977.1 flagellar FlbD family protein [Candidatus Eremiobacteraeota bacterium]MBV8584362.1 flagellar FlbD family protein [Candidatus Eremiobacteraeota bacterium]
MIALTRLNGHLLMINCDLIESLEETPDTVVTLVSGNKIVIRDKMRDVQDKIIAFKRKIYGPGDPGA